MKHRITDTLFNKRQCHRQYIAWLFALSLVAVLSGCEQTNYSSTPILTYSVNLGISNDDASEELLTTYANEIASQFEPGHVVLDSVASPEGSKDITLHLTREAYDEIRKKTPHISGASIDLLVYDELLPDQISEPLIDDELYVCTHDDECVFIQADTCGCSAMGKATAINSQYVEYWEAQVYSDEASCLQSFSNDPSCKASPRCVNAVCQLVN